MKKLMLILVTCTAFMYSCDKDDGPTEEEIKTELLTKRIQEIIPQQYLDTLKKYGLEINMGINPPNVEGIYRIEPQLLKATNIINDNPIGTKFVNTVFSFFSQNNDDFSIDFISKDETAQGSTTRNIDTAISGAGNDFTVYGIVKSERSGGSVVFAYIYSGTMEDGVLKNLHYGFINVDDTNRGTSSFITEGQARILYDGDYVSERLKTYDFEGGRLPNPASDSLLSALESILD